MVVYLRSLDVCPDCGSKLSRVGNCYVCSGQCCRFVAGDAYDIEAWGVGYEHAPENARWEEGRQVFTDILSLIRSQETSAEKYKAKSLIERVLKFPLDNLNATSFLARRNDVVRLWDSLADDKAPPVPKHDWFLVTPFMMGPSVVSGLEIWSGGAISQRTSDNMTGYTGLGVFRETVNLCFSLATLRMVIALDAGPTRMVYPNSLNYLPGLSVPAAKESYRLIVADEDDLNYAINATLQFPGIPMAVLSGGGVSNSNTSVGGTVVQRAITLRESGDEEGLKRFLTNLTKTDEIVVRLRMAGFDVRSRSPKAVVTGLNVGEDGYVDQDGQVATFSLEPVAWEEDMAGRRKLSVTVSVAGTQFTLSLGSKELASGKDLIKAVMSACVDQGTPARLLRKKEAETILVDTLAKAECVDVREVTMYPQRHGARYLLPGATISSDGIETTNAVTGPEFVTSLTSEEIPVTGEELNLLLIASAMVARSAAGWELPILAVHPDHSNALASLSAWLGQKSASSGCPSRPFCHVGEPSSPSQTQGSICLRHDGIRLVNAGGITANPVEFIRRSAQAALLGLAAFTKGKPDIDVLTAEGSYLFDTIYPGRLPVRLDLQDLPHTCRFLKKIIDETEKAVVFSFRSQKYCIRPQDYDVDKKKVFEEMSARDRDVFTDGAEIFLPIETWKSLSLSHYRREVVTGKRS